MLIRKQRPASGTCFAWLPKPTSEGTVWLEYVHFEWNDTEFGSYSYRRVPTFYSTPPNPEKCKNYQHDGPTPCWHPHCTCMREAFMAERRGAFKNGPYSQ